MTEILTSFNRIWLFWSKSETGHDWTRSTGLKNTFWPNNISLLHGWRSERGNIYSCATIVVLRDGDTPSTYMFKHLRVSYSGAALGFLPEMGKIKAEIYLESGTNFNYCLPHPKTITIVHYRLFYIVFFFVLNKSVLVRAGHSAD